MKRTEPLIFKYYPRLKKNVPWIPLLTNVPTPVEDLTELEKKLGLEKGHLSIKRDDKIYHIYGGNKLRKLEFIFGNVFKKKKRAIVTCGGIGTNHGLACLVVCNSFNPPLKCDLFLYEQPLTWHVQRMLLLYDHFGANLHLGKTDITTVIKALLFWIFHRKYEFILPGASPLFGRGTPLGIVGFIEAIFELKEQINKGIIPEPNAIFVAGGTTGTAAGLIAGCKLLELKTRVHVVAVLERFLVQPSNIVKNANKALKYLNKKDKSFPNLEVSKEDFELITEYVGSGYGVKTIKGQKAVDTLYELEGKEKDFKLETTYTGKAMAAMLDFLEKPENKSKRVLFWDTYNSNNLDNYLRETQFNYKKLPEKFHKFFEEAKFQCWQITDCPDDIKKNCPAYLNHEYRFWKVTDCLLDENKKQKAFKELQNVIELEDA